MPISAPASPSQQRRGVGRNDAPSSARNMSAPAQELYGKSNENTPPPNIFVGELKAKATPPATPPRNGKSPNLFSPPAYSSPNPLAHSAGVKPTAIPVSISTQAKSTPPATPPRANAQSAGTVLSPPTAVSAAPRFNALATASPACSSPVPSRRAHVLAASTGTPNVFSPAPRVNAALAVSSPACASPVPSRRANTIVAEAPRTPNVSSPATLRRTTALAQIPLPKTPDVSSPAPTRANALAAAAPSVDVSSPAKLNGSTGVQHPVHDHVFSLKSSRGVNVVRSPLAKDYLLAQLAAKPDSPLTRSKSPPPRTTPISSPACASPAYASPACESPGRIRKLSEPVPIQYDHLRRNIDLKGSCDAISMPYNITHTTHVDTKSMAAIPGNKVVVLNNSTPLYEKSGYLHKLAGSTFKERWFECRRSTLSYYEKKDHLSKPRGEIYLSDCEFMRDKANKRPHTLHVLHTPTKKSYYFAAANAELMEEWIRAFHGSGAIDKDLVVMEKELKEKEKKQEAARLAKEQKKKEDEYVKAKLKKRSTLKIINRNMPDSAMETCLCTLSVQEIVEKDSGQEFKISVTFDDQHWTIMRSYDKVAKMYDAVSKLKFIKGMCPPRKCPSTVPLAEFSQLQISKLQNLLDLLARNRPCVFAAASPRQRFLRFIAPVGWEDVKPDPFVMPFQFDF